MRAETLATADRVRRSFDDRQRNPFGPYGLVRSMKRKFMFQLSGLIKRIGLIRFTDGRPADYWAERGYDWYAGH
jgi:hypothetical protein